MQDISLSDSGRKVSRTSGTQVLAEIKAADRVPESLGRRLCILGRYVGAVLTAFLTPAAPILSIKTDVRAFRNQNAVPRGILELSHAGECAVWLSLHPAHTGKTGTPMGTTRREKKAKLCSDLLCEVAA